MTSAFDASTLLYLLQPDAPPPTDPVSGDLVLHCQARLTHLLVQLEKAKATIVIPTPVLSELLSHAEDAAAEWLQTFTRSRYFRLAPFDLLAAIECAAMARARRGAGRAGELTKRKAKFDEQIVAIARVHRAEVIYSDDEHIRRLVGDTMLVKGMADLELPAQDRQMPLAFEETGIEPAGNGD